jgi:CBS domain containing-hemolysin-like protein
MSDVALLIFYFFLALGVSFACSVLEAVLLSVRRTFIERMKKEGTKGARAWDRLRENRNRALAAILILNTVAHTFGAAGVGAKAMVVFESVPVSVISAILTLLILVVSEIIPKTLGANYWRQLAPACGILLDWLVRVMHPLVWLSERITAVFERKGKGGDLSREEVAAMLELGLHEGALEPQESRIMRNLIRLQPMKVSDIMTPRTVVFCVPETMRVEEFLKEHVAMPFSRIPVKGNSLDDLTGFVLRDEILLARAEQRADATLSGIKRELKDIPESAPVWAAFEQLVGGREHIRAVRDEFGGLAGIVTLEDVVETLLGMEIVDEADHDVDMQEKARRLWRQRAEVMGIATDESASEKPG